MKKYLIIILYFWLLSTISATEVKDRNSTKKLTDYEKYLEEIKKDKSLLDELSITGSFEIKIEKNF